MVTLALYIVAAVLILFFAAVFVVALIQTIKEIRSQKRAGFNADLGLGGELGIKLIKKPQ